MKEYLVLLRQILTERFDEEELRTFCFDLGLRYDDLPGRGKVAKARELVAHLERRKRVPDCIEVGKQSRPDIIWEQIQLARLEAAQEVAPDPRRFQPLIDELQATIGLGEGRVERQRERIAAGLIEERQRRAEEQARRHERERVRVVGQPPLDVTNYFKDRQRELEELRNALVEPTTRLVSVIGHGGMGKTALTCKALQDLERHRWPQTDEDLPVDGIVYLSTRTAGISLERLFLDCAKLLGGKREEHLNTVWTNPQLETETKIARLLNTLGDGRYVILLDNLEDLLDDRGQFLDDELRLLFDQALITGHGAQIIVTSRVGLAFHREVMRFDRQVKLLEGLPIGDGVALLRELDPNGDYGLRDAPEGKLAEAVKLTYGVPRALEVLAGILANDPFVSLDEVMETFYEQEDVVRALIEENYRRLDQDARRVIEALAVFRKPVSSLAVDYLLEPFAPGLDVPGIVRRLTHTNIVSVDRVAKTLTLHPIDQDYAYSQLPDAESSGSDYNRQALEHQAANYYARIRRPHETWNSIEDLEPQLNEFEHLVRSGDLGQAANIMEAIDSQHLCIWGHYERLVEMRKQLVGRLGEGYLEARNLGRLGVAYYALGDYAQACYYSRSALLTSIEIGDKQGESIWRSNLGRICFTQGRFKEAEEYYEQALETACSIDDLRQRSLLLGRLGSIHTQLGDFDLSSELTQEGLALAREINDLQIQTELLYGLGTSHRIWMLTYEAIEYFNEGLAIACEIGDRMLESRCYGSLSLCNRDLGNLELAIELGRKGRCVAKEISDRRGEGIRNSMLALAYMDLGKTERAIELQMSALSIAQEIGDRKSSVISLDIIGDLWYKMGKIDDALEFTEKSLYVASQVYEKRTRSYALFRKARISLERKDLLRAYEHCVEGRQFAAVDTEYWGNLLFGTILLHQKDLEKARAVFEEVILSCRALLESTPGLVKPRYVLATASVGHVVSGPGWNLGDTKEQLLAPVLEKYRRTLKITAAQGIVQDAIRDLKLIQAAGIEGLEPLFELLQNAEYEPDETA